MREFLAYLRKNDIFIKTVGNDLSIRFPKNQINNELLDQIKQKKQELIEYLNALDNSGYASISVSPEQDYYPMSSAQKRMYFVQELAPDSTSFNMPMVNYLGINCNTGKIKEIIRELIIRHESLRTSFHKIENSVYQKIQNDFHFELVEKQCTSLEFSSYWQEFVKPFDLSKAPLIRSAIVHIPDVGYMWIVDLHHIIADGTSLEVLKDDFTSLYKGMELPKLKIQYKDFSRWQMDLSQNDNSKKQISYWLSQFETEVPSLDFPLDNPRPSVFNFQGDNHEFKLGSALTERLRKFSSVNQSSIQMTLLAVLNVLFNKYTGQEDIVIGLGMEGRLHPDVERIVGMFVNTLPVRSYPKSNKTFLDFHKEVCLSSISAYENQNIQFEELVDVLKIERDPSRNPLFDVVLSGLNFEASRSDSSSLFPDESDVTSFGHHYRPNVARLDMTWYVTEDNNGININVEYYSPIFNDTTIQQLGRHFVALLSDILANPFSPINLLKVLTKQEEDALIVRGSGAPLLENTYETLHSLFKSRSLITPENIAIYSDNKRFTYKQIDEASNQLANFLIGVIKIQNEEKIGLLQCRGSHMIVSILAILKAGGTYVPLEQAFPEERLIFMVTDSAIKTLLTDKDHVELSNRLQWRNKHLENLVCVDSNNFYGERGALKNELMRQDLWDYIGETTKDQISGGGWISSYTGKYLGEAEMNEYANNAYLKLKPFLGPDVRVLEIGCASGLTMFQIAPEVGFYYGTDLSPTILEKTSIEVDKKGYKNIELQCFSADQIDKIDQDSFDVVIINSVIQSFDGHNYLREVVCKAIAKMKTTGVFFIGDIMDEDQRENLINDLKEFKKNNNSSDFQTKTEFSSELFISRDFWKDFSLGDNGITKIDFSDKIYSIENELTRFRYDLILTIDKNFKRSNIPKKKKNQFDGKDIALFGSNDVQVDVDHNQLAYIIYTSGTTGNPKGVMIEHKGVVNTILSQIKAFDIKAGDRCLQFASAAFDASIWEIFISLLSGGELYIIDEVNKKEPTQFEEYITSNKIEIATLPPAFLRVLSIYKLSTIRKLITAGEPAVIKDVRTFSQHGIYFNAYGPTEANICATVSKIDSSTIIGNVSVPIGKPIASTNVYIVDNELNLLPSGAVGEICIGGHGVSRGYLNLPLLTNEKFRSDPFVPGGRLYRTGDRGRWLDNGDLVFLGRADNQVKIRGYRVELGEIENQIRANSLIDDAVVILNGASDKSLVCFYVSEYDITDIELKGHLSVTLPEYMIPSTFVKIEKIPLSVSGKVIRSKLPFVEHNPNDIQQSDDNNLEIILINLWAEILNLPISKVNKTANFFHLGGNSLNAISLVSSIHKATNVKLNLSSIFEHQTIEQLAKHISVSNRIDYSSILSAVPKPYYPLSSAQKRLYFLQQLDSVSTSYNIPSIIPVPKSLVRKELQDIILKLFKRHESLRTNFVLLDGVPYQQIKQDVCFDIEYASVGKAELNNFLNNFVRPFDLGIDLLMRACLIETEEDNNLLVVDMHHIIADGSSSIILKNDFLSLINGRPLSNLKYQYKDFSEWQNHLFKENLVKKQEDYWCKLYEDGVPRLNLNGDFKRPEIFSFKGDTFSFVLDQDETGGLRHLSQTYGATIYMTILALLNTLFHKYTGQTDIVIGCNSAGRPHADFTEIVGMFVNTLAMRNKPEGGKKFTDLLAEVIQNSLAAFDNQDIQFEDLIDKLHIERDPSRNPLFDVCMLVQNYEEKGNENIDIDKSFAKYPNEIVLNHNIAKFDLTFFIYESVNNFSIQIEYYTGLFEFQTVKRISEHFKELLKIVIDNPSIELKKIDLLPTPERILMLENFNSSQVQYQRDKGLHMLFEEQVIGGPERIALTMGSESMTYKELNDKANQLANYLIHKCEVLPGDIIGIYLERSFFQVIAMLGILKAGAAYLPIDNSLPESRIKSIVDDSSLKVLLSQSFYIRDLNRFLWECPCLKGYFCFDSVDVKSESENVKNASMDSQLWEFIGKNSVDAVTGGGWISSYTGQPFSKAEMDEYAENILKKVQPYINNESRVLEIGCASGISMFKIAPYTGFYYGTDLSSVIIEKNRRSIVDQGYSNVKVDVCYAHEIDKLEEKGFDLIVLNSVVQSFHGHNYLFNVIKKCIALLNDSGILFIGDIMDLDSKSDMESDLLAYKRLYSDIANKTKTDFSSELFLSKSYFEHLKYDISSIENISFSKKIANIENELTRFRYDVIIEVNKLSNKTAKSERVKFQHDSTELHKYDVKNLSQKYDQNSLIYAIYTSGTTGIPKGAGIENRNFHNLVNWFADHYQLRREDNFLVLTSLSFDLTQKNIFAPLICGGEIVLSRKGPFDPQKIIEEIKEHDVKNINCTPGMFYQLLSEDENDGYANLKSLRKVFLGGEPIELIKLEQWKNSKNCHAKIYNTYGPTECADICLSHELNFEIDKTAVPLGKPIYNSEIFIINHDQHLSPLGIPGEICISGEGVGRGYLNKIDLTKEKFVKNPFKERQRLYKTGDLGRWLSNGKIEFLGRKDDQVKLRGFRIELGDIEAQLRHHELIQDAVVVMAGDEEKAIYAYYVSDENIQLSDLRSFLAKSLPDYMIPSFLIKIPKIPLTTHGKINKKELPLLKKIENRDYEAPISAIEHTLVRICSEILDIPVSEISMGGNFFEMGGHSLKATILVAKIHKALNVKIPLSEIFRRPVLKNIATLVATSKSEQFYAIEPGAKQKTYPLSSAQKRLFFLSHFEDIGTSYNMPSLINVTSNYDVNDYISAIEKIVQRHESLRTSFSMVNDEPVQIIHDAVSIKLEEFEITSDEGDEIYNIFKKFVRPFDLSIAPLFRAGIIKVSESNQILLYDLHHIISDGTSLMVLEDDFKNILEGRELPPLKIQYRDFAIWQNALISEGKIKDQEKYWLEKFSGVIPKLQLPLDHARPVVFSFKGGYHDFRMGRAVSSLFLTFCKNYQVTPFMHLLACLNILLHKLTADEDIIIGNSTFGRVHADLRHMIGMFVNELAIRSNPQGSKSYTVFIDEVKEDAVKAFENQDYQFEELINKLNISRDSSRNPLFDVCFSYQNFEVLGIDKDTPAPNLPANKTATTSKFDLTLYASEYIDDILLGFEYCTSLFKEETIKRFADYLIDIIKQVSSSPETLISSISLVDFTGYKSQSTVKSLQLSYPYKCVHELFEERVQIHPDRIALVMNNENLTYSDLDARSNRIANYLLEQKKVKADEIVGVLMDKSIISIVAILGILKSGAAYLPLSPDTTHERLLKILKDAGVRVMISEKANVKILNRLQWESPGFESYICLDSYNIHKEKEPDNNLMDKELWEFVGKRGDDPISKGGWLSSYTGLPLSNLEMDEYSNNILLKIQPFLNSSSRVLEIGCATGLSMYKIAPLVGSYYGTDLSSYIINENREIIESDQKYSNIKLQCLAAHEIYNIEEENFDLIIINSVIQHFHGHNYLREVISQCISKLNSEGIIFIGDVMDQDRKSQLIEELIEFGSLNKRSEYKTKTDWSEELFISQGYFDDLQVVFDEIQNIHFSEKLGSIQNELTKFRYDAILKIDKGTHSKSNKPRKKYQDDLRNINLQNTLRPTTKVEPSNLCYVIYTSGTTGVPKGVMIEHRNVVSLISHHNSPFDFSTNDTWTLFHSQSFDFSVWELYGCLLSGGKLVLVSKELSKDINGYLNLLIKEDVTVLNVTPSTFNVLQDIEQQRKTRDLQLRYVIFGGEPLSTHMLKAWMVRYPHVHLINMYGITETTVHVTYKKLEDVDIETGLSNIGKALPSLHTYVMDNNLNLMPIGIPGELMIGGEGVARGYLNDPVLTESKFIVNPINLNEKIYRSGDLVRLTTTGDIEYLGRKDRQVKIRGYRVELGEIEYQLRRYHLIKDVVADIVKDKDSAVCAYYLADTELDTSDLRSFMKRLVPEYMVPLYFLKIDKIPLTSNGKVDRKGLPDPSVRKLKNLVPPVTSTEVEMVGIWSEILNVSPEEIGIDNDFFEIGGHSLKATVLMAKIQQAFNVYVPLSEIFSFPTIKEIGYYIDAVNGRRNRPVSEDEEREEIDI